MNFVSLDFVSGNIEIEPRPQGFSCYHPSLVPGGDEMRDPGNGVDLDSRNKNNYKCYPRDQSLSVKCLAEETDQNNKPTRY